MGSSVAIMNKSFVVTSLMLGIFSCNTPPPQAQNINLDNKICEDAIASVEGQLKADHQLTIEISETINHSYPDGPEGRPNQYRLGIRGNAANSVMESDVLLNSLATQIINNCNSISLVSFGVYQTDYILDYGLISKGKVEKFQCPEDFDGLPYKRDFQWGESC
ncbi:hypothetical protein [Pleurocapsa sp. PCC 7319]|uniref:hypothetical protein n=1 Tax=Pleurocapsa sp. PCC 7319 TaxID=118161 RepID=UPI000348168E|nr:hypothetical protein [Pleurocapsa sp. PCC 7319]